MNTKLALAMFAIVVGSGFNPDLAAARPAGRPSTGSTTTRTAAPSRPAPAPARPAPAPAKAAAPSGAAIQPRQNTGAPNSGTVAKPSGAANLPRQNTGAPNSGAVAKPSGAASQPRTGAGAPPKNVTTVTRQQNIRVVGRPSTIVVVPSSRGTFFGPSYAFADDYYNNWFLTYALLRQARTESEISRLRLQLERDRLAYQGLPASQRPAQAVAFPDVTGDPGSLPAIDSGSVLTEDTAKAAPVVVNVQQPKEDKPDFGDFLGWSALAAGGATAGTVLYNRKKNGGGGYGGIN
jgi:hypothetical protein